MNYTITVLCILLLVLVAVFYRIFDVYKFVDNRISSNSIMSSIVRQPQFPEVNNYIFIGHQSVGENILQGINDFNIKLNIKDSYIGENRDPYSKMKDFENQITPDMDIVMLKFCFVDITSDTDIEKLFDAYIQMVQRIKEKFPHIRIIHTTIPLTSKIKSFKSLSKDVIKLLMNKPLYNAYTNGYREQYNDKIRYAFNKKDIFDIAHLESVYGGYLENYYPALHPDYTYDGGHLNEKGRKILAYELLNLL